ncbi:hypothetical protein EN46_27250, partial [Citrobacter amalonaticus]
MWQEPANGNTMSMAGGERLHAAGVHTGSQILDLWIHLKITFPHHHVFPDKTGLMMEGGAFPMIYDWYIQQQTEAAYGLALDDEDFSWQFRGVASDHVNTFML